MKRCAYAIAALSFVIMTACAKPQASADENFLKALDAAYVAAWLQEDAALQEKEVLALFDRNAVIMPGGGLQPEDGISNLKKFWFPDGAPPTIVTHFEHDVADVDVSGDIGVLSGRYTLSFTYENQSMAQAGNYMIVAKNGVGGWRIIRMIWNDQALTEV